MKEFFAIPGLNHIGENILMSLDCQSLMNCQCVCKSIDEFLKSNPKFWLKICVRQGITNDLFRKWKSLIEETNDYVLNLKITLLLKKVLYNAPKTFQSPIHVAAKSGDFSLLEHIILLSESTTLRQDMDASLFKGDFIQHSNSFEKFWTKKRDEVNAKDEHDLTALQLG